MKKNWRVVLALALALSMAFSTGCKLEEEAVTMDTPAENTEAVSGRIEIDLTAPAATVGEDRVVTVEKFKDMFDMYSYYYSINGFDVTMDQELMYEFQDLILDTLLQAEVVYHQVEEQGYLDRLTEEQKAEVEAMFNDEMEGLKEYYDELIAAEKEANPDLDEEQFLADAIAEESLYYAGSSLTMEEYEEWIYEQCLYGYCSDLMMNDLLKDISITDDDVIVQYTSLLTEGMTTYASDLDAYKSDQENYEIGGGYPVVYVPEGYSRILHIYTEPAGAIEDTYEDYNDKVERMAEIEALYGELSFQTMLKDEPSEKTAEVETQTAEGEATGEEKPLSLEELMAEYKTLEAEIAAMEEAHYSAPLAKVQEAYEKLQAGEDFRSVMMEYSENTTFETYPIFQEIGLLINPSIENSNYWSDVICGEFSKLSLGEYSEPFQDDGGYHIIYYLADEVPGERGQEGFTEIIRAQLLEDTRNEEWNAILDAWFADESVVKRYPENYRMVGEE